MSSSHVLTFDQDTPHRAVLHELGGGAKENSALRKPDPVRMATAEDFNQMSRQLEAANRVLPLVRLFVSFTGGNPALTVVQALGNNVAVPDFTVEDVGAGDTRISWTTGSGGKLPAAVGPGELTIISDTAIDEKRAFMTTVGSNPAVRVKTKNGGVGTDANFSVAIF